jgi:hypothetical protein
MAQRQRMSRAISVMKRHLWVRAAAIAPPNVQLPRACGNRVGPGPTSGFGGFGSPVAKGSRETTTSGR